MSSRIRIAKHNKIPVVKLSGEFMSQRTPELSKRLQGLIDDEHDIIAIDMSEADYLDSYCLGVFVYSWKLMHEAGREIVFVNPSEFVTDLLSETKLSFMIRVVPTLEAL